MASSVEISSFVWDHLQHCQYKECKESKTSDLIRYHETTAILEHLADEELKKRQLMSFYIDALKCFDHSFYANISGFDCLCVTNAPPDEVELCIIFYHGLGSCAQHFSDVWEIFFRMFGSSVPAMVVLPNAPHLMETSELGASGGKDQIYKWWDIVDPSWQCSVMMNNKQGPIAKNKRSKANDVPTGLEDLRTSLGSLRGELSRLLKLPPTRFAVGGFSMGGMLAADCLFTMHSPPLAVGVFSGAPFALSQWSKAVKRWSVQEKAVRQGIPIIQTHGTEDSVLYYKLGQTLGKIFRSFGLHHRFAAFLGDHVYAGSHLELWYVNVVARLRDVLLREDVKSSLLPFGEGEVPDNRLLRLKGDQFGSHEEPPLPLKFRLGVIPSDYTTLRDGCILRFQSSQEFIKSIYEKCLRTPMRKFTGESPLRSLSPLRQTSALDLADLVGPTAAEFKTLRCAQYKALKRSGDAVSEDSDERLVDSTDSLEAAPRGDREEEIEENATEITFARRTPEMLQVAREEERRGKKNLSVADKGIYKATYGILSCCLPIASRVIKH